MNHKIILKFESPNKTSHTFIKIKIFKELYITGVIVDELIYYQYSSLIKELSRLNSSVISCLHQFSRYFLPRGDVPTFRIEKHFDAKNMIRIYNNTHNTRYKNFINIPSKWFSTCKSADYFFENICGIYIPECIVIPFLKHIGFLKSKPKTKIYENRSVNSKSVNSIIANNIMGEQFVGGIEFPK